VVSEHKIQRGCTVGINSFRDAAAAGVIVEGPHRIRDLRGGCTRSRIGYRGGIGYRRCFGDRGGRGRRLRGCAGAAVVGAGCAGQTRLTYDSELTAANRSEGDSLPVCIFATVEVLVTVRVGDGVCVGVLVQPLLAQAFLTGFQ